MNRLERSLGEIEMAMPVTRAARRLICGEVARRNGVGDGLLYIQSPAARQRHRRHHGNRPVLGSVRH